LKEVTMEQLDFALTGGSVMLPDGRLEPLSIGVKAGRIAVLADGALDAEETLDVAGLTVVPGLVDEHFHVFWGYGWETYRGATRAAAKGGITTVVDMPLDNPATLSVQRIQEKLAHVRSECHVDYALFGGYEGENPDEVAALAEAGVVALKLFTGGVAPPGMYPGADSGEILDCMRRAQREGLVVVVHCENAEIVDFETARLQAEGRTGAEAWDEARPWYSEVEAVQRVALLAEVTGCRTVIAHVTSHQSVEAVREARRRGADVWIETCPHYLCLTTEDMAKDGRLKWNPPSRSPESVERLWELLRDGHVHTIGSDHAPLPKKAGADVWEQLPGAGNGLETMLPVVATEAAQRGIPLQRVVDLLSTAPARVFRLYPRKGTIAVGADADLAVLETNGKRTLDAAELEYHEQERWSPFDGREVTVYPVYTILRGRVIAAEGAVLGEPGYGELVTTRAAVAV
jgi:allantoinase